MWFVKYLKQNIIIIIIHYIIFWIIDFFPKKNKLFWNNYLIKFNWYMNINHDKNNQLERKSKIIK